MKALRGRIVKCRCRQLSARVSMPYRASVLALILCCGAGATSAETPRAPAALDCVLKLQNRAANDQDDLCVWRDEEQPDRSVVIASDKAAHRLFVYDLAGDLLQEIPLPKPGNIDIRQGVFGGLDVVAVNQRAEPLRLHLFRVDHDTRRLIALDADVSLQSNYGGCLYHDGANDRLYYFGTSTNGLCQQLELLPGKTFRGRVARNWRIGKCEGAVADDERHILIITEEQRGLWQLGARPEAHTPGKLIARVGEHGLTGDLEGVALSPAPERWVVVSDQGRDRFVAFESDGDHRFIGTAAVAGVGQTDGIAIVAGAFSERFPGGIFGCHNGASRPCPIELRSWQAVRTLFVR
jgi:myo-inositol-hexaphosphate 3-phosphohydrolase